MFVIELNYLADYCVFINDLRLGYHFFVDLFDLIIICLNDLAICKLLFVKYCYFWLQIVTISY